MAVMTINFSPFAQQIYTLSRPTNAALPAFALLTGFLVGGGSFRIVDWLLIALMASGLLFHSGLTIANDLNDRDVDSDNGVATILTRGTKADVRRVQLAALLLCLVGLGLTVLLPLYVQASLLLMAILAIMYNFRPFMFSRRPVSSIAALGALYGSLPFFVGYFMYARDVTMYAVAMAVFWGIARASLSILKDFKDVKGDKKHGKRTFLLHFGRQTTIVTSNVLAGVGLVGVGAAGLHYVTPGWWPCYLLTLAIASGAIVRQRRLLTPGKENMTFHELLRVQAFFDGGVLLWVLLS